MSPIDSVRQLGRLVLVVPLALTACSRDPGSAAAEKGPVATTIGPENIAIVMSDSISSGPAVAGTLEPERVATIRAQVGGSVLRVKADQGTRVAAGDVLAELDDRTLRDALLSARSALTTAQTNAERANRDLERYEKLAQAGAVSERDLEQMRWNARAAESQLADARARLTIAEKQLEDARVKAPFAGVVSVRAVSEGDVVQPGATLFTVVDPSSMRYEASVPAAQLTAVRIGAPVFFRVTGYPERTFRGRVVRISPVADQSTGQVRVTVAVANASGTLVGGLFADGKIAAEVHNGLVVPIGAVDMRGVRPAVLRVKNGTVERLEVRLGIRDEAAERIELLSGVELGDTLLLSAAHGIAPGTAVKVLTGDTPQRKE